MFIIYNLIFLLFTAIYLPVYLFKGKFHKGFLTRLGVGLPQDLALNRPIWIHAVSLGEAIAVKGVIERLRESYPEKRLVISTVTPTGNKIARDIAKGTDLVTYLPLDFSFVVKKVINKINPCLFIIAETEIWPNLIYRLHKNNIPVAVINARISDKSFKGYTAGKFFVKQILSKVDLFCAQTERDAERLIDLGAFKDKVKVTGNLKFDNTKYTVSQEDFTGLKQKLGVSERGNLLVAGSTHEGEEEIVLSSYKGLLKEFPDLKLLIAPRHPERANEIEKIIIKNGFSPIRVSQLSSQSANAAFGGTPPFGGGRQTIFIIDTVGQLMDFYAIGDIIFVGGSLIKKGGHNILEPASLGKPVIFGPYMFNFRDIADLFINANACILIHGKEELNAAINDLLTNPDKMEELGKRGRNIIMQNQGAAARMLEHIKGLKQVIIK